MYDWNDAAFARYFADSNDDKEICGVDGSLPGDYLSVWEKLRTDRAMYGSTIFDYVTSVFMSLSGMNVAIPEWHVPFTERIKRLGVAGAPSAEYDDEHWRDESLVAIEGNLFAAPDYVAVRSPFGVYSASIQNWGPPTKESWPSDDYSVWKEHQVKATTQIIQVSEAEPGDTTLPADVVAACLRLEAAARDMPLVAQRLLMDHIEQKENSKLWEVVAAAFSPYDENYVADKTTRDIICPAIVLLSPSDRAVLDATCDQGRMEDIYDYLQSLVRIEIGPTEFSISDLK
jgi:hypothetical protein